MPANFTGSLAISGSLIISGSILTSGSITISGSIASASYAEFLGGLPSSSFASASVFNQVSASFASTSGSIAGRVNIIETSYATTGSNNFTRPQQISDVSNAISFTSTASLYTDGGLRVNKDSFVSGTAYFNNVVVYGTSSIQYITSSQVNIGTNIITVNTDTPAVRFGGLAVFDSGSTQLTGSLLWDSEANHWIYSNPSGSTYSGGMLISGPRAASLGTEVGTTACSVMIGQGGDHITSSGIFSYGNATCFYGTSYVSGSGAICTSNTIIGTTIYGATAICGGSVTGTCAVLSGNGLFGGSTNAGNAGTNTVSVGVPGSVAGGLQLWAATNQTHFIQFGDGTASADNYRGYIAYAHGTDTLTLGTAATDKLTISSTGAATFTGQVQSNDSFYVINTPPATNGALINVRDTVTATNVTSFAGVFFNSSPGNDYSIGKLTENNAGFLQIRNANNGNELLRINNTGAATFSSSVTATSFTSTLSSGYNIVLNKGGGPAIQFNKTDATARSWEMSGGDAFYIYDGTASAYRFYINSSGNVGIGTTSPSGVLHVVKDGAGNANTNITGSQLILSRTTGATENIAFRNTGTSAGISGLTYAGQIISDGNNGFEIFTDGSTPVMIGTSATERMRINSSGDLLLKGRSTTANYDAVFYNDNSQLAINATNTSAAKAINFNISSTINAMSITSGGNVGIGTTSINASSGYKMLRINGATTGGEIVLAGNEVEYGYMYASSGIFVIDALGNYPLRFRTNAGNRMEISGGGVVTIANLAGSGTRTVTADASGNLAAASDSSLKQEDTTHQIEGLAEILQLQPRAYKWLNDIEIRGEEAATEIGFFADEVASIIPSAAPKCQDGLYGFYDRAVIAAMVKAIQELKAENDALKLRIENLESK